MEGLGNSPNLGLQEWLQEHHPKPGAPDVPDQEAGKSESQCPNCWLQVCATVIMNREWGMELSKSNQGVQLA